MRLTVRGSGDAHGIPRADCDDPACACARARAGRGPRRGPTAALVEAEGCRLAIDCGAEAVACDALLLTHYHPDHAGGVDAFRGAPAYGPPAGWCEAEEPGLERWPPPPGTAALAPFVTIAIGPCAVTPLPLNHPIPAYGWAIAHGGARIAWLTDSYGIPAATLAWLRAHPCAWVALDTTFPPGEPSAPRKGHGDLAISLAALAESGAARGLLIHIGHRLQRWLDEGGALPTGIAVAHDGMEIQV